MLAYVPLLQASGQAMYTSDVHKSARDLFAAPVESQRALAKLGRVDAGPALKLEGVVAYIGEAHCFNQ